METRREARSNVGSVGMRGSYARQPSARLALASGAARQIDHPRVRHRRPHHFAREVEPAAAAVEHAAVGGGDDGRGVDQLAVGARHQLDLPGPRRRRRQRVDRLLEPPAVRDRSIEEPDQLAAGRRRGERRDRFQRRPRAAHAAIVPAHRGQIAHHAVAAEQQDAARKRRLDREQHVVAVDQRASRRRARAARPGGRGAARDRRRSRRSAAPPCVGDRAARADRPPA